MKTFFDDVGEFNKKFGLPVTAAGRRCEFPDHKALAYRLGFMEEELMEYRIAVANGDLPGALDALVDLAYVAMGTAHYYGAPFNEAWRAVHQANLKKELAPTGETHPERGPVETLRKPVGWEPPDIRYAIDWHNYLLDHP